MRKYFSFRKHWPFLILTIAGALFIAMLVFSPYQNDKNFPYQLVKHEVEINAPVEKVFAYLGNSKNASKLSVYVNHINSLNPEIVADGKPGSRRRCFTKADEKGAQWDELITEVVPNKKRQLTIYNLVDFPITAENLATEQLYEKAADNKCHLTFTVFFKDAEPTYWEYVKMKFAAFTIKSVFEKNMANIKNNVEQLGN